MANCTICGVETELYVNGRPLCVHCTTAAQSHRNPSERVRIREELEQAETIARAELDAALAAFGSFTAGRDGKAPAGSIAHANESLTRINLARERFQAARRRRMEFDSNS